MGRKKDPKVVRKVPRKKHTKKTNVSKTGRIARQQKQEESYWSKGDIKWVDNPKVSVVYFLDNCISIKSLYRIPDEVKVLNFPGKLEGVEDPDVLTSVINFIKIHSTLKARGVKFYFVSVDHDFLSDSKARELLVLSESGINLKFLIINISKLVAEQLYLAYEGDTRWVQTV